MISGPGPLMIAGLFRTLRLHPLYPDYPTVPEELRLHGQKSAVPQGTTYTENPVLKAPIPELHLLSPVPPPAGRIQKRHPVV